jgi:predicted secreted acid phosphatase
MRRSGQSIGWALAIALFGAETASAQSTPPIPSSELPPPGPSSSPTAPNGMQFLYGSGEAAANTRTIWHALVDYVTAHRKDRKSVVLAPDATLETPHLTPCTKSQPLAAVFDVDETVLLNAGAEYDSAIGEPYSDTRWQQWEVYGASKPLASPGAVEAMRALRTMGVTVIFNTNRLAVHAKENEEAIEHAGLGAADYFADPARWRDQTLYLAASMRYPDTAKDPRRRAIASHYCVIAMGGDQLGDFSDLFNPHPAIDPQVRRGSIDKASTLADLWGRGWFTFPNPVYGTALTGTIDQVFPKSVRWPDP